MKLFGKYYMNEKITFWFITFMPYILMGEACLYAMFVNKKFGEITDFIMFFCVPLLGIIGGALILIQILSHIVFVLKLGKLTQAQKENVRYEAENSIKKGRILKTNDVLIYYGMFSKKVLLMNEILDWYPNSGVSSQRMITGGCWSVSYDVINVKMKSGKVKELNCSMACFGGCPGELPYRSINITILVSIILIVTAVIQCFFL